MVKRCWWMGWGLGLGAVVEEARLLLRLAAVCLRVAMKITPLAIIEGRIIARMFCLSNSLGLCVTQSVSAGSTDAARNNHTILFRVLCANVRLILKSNYMARLVSSAKLTQMLIAGAVLSAVILPTPLLVTQRLHHDEALYATWALRVATGQDIWLTETILDKPPLLIYTVAASLWLFGATETAARLPSLLATAAIIWLTYRLGRAWYNSATGILAAWLVALSPYTLCFAPTAFTDPLLVACVLASCYALTQRQPLAAGLWFGLAMATKQQAVLFGGLVVGWWLIQNLSVTHRRLSLSPSVATHSSDGLRFALSLSLVLSLLWVWDAQRVSVPSFLTHSAANYGGLRLDLSGFGERWLGFGELLWYATASPALTAIFLVGLPWLFTTSVLRCVSASQADSASSTDGLLILFCLLWLTVHAAFSFQVWDRYLLGLLPLLGLLMARLLLMPTHLLGDSGCRGYHVTIAVLLSITLSQPIQDSLNGRYPIGSHSHAVQGIEQIVAYMRGNVAAETTLHHRWLGTHWRFYLHGFPYDLDYWDTPAALIESAQAGDLIAFPTWHSATPTRLALQDAGLKLREEMRAYNLSGSPTIILYRLENISSVED